MSRLADQLTGMDRAGARRPEGVGGIPDLAASGEGRRWRPVLVLVIVVGIVMLSGAAVALRPKSAVMTLPAPRAPVPRQSPASAPTANDRYEDLVSRGVRAADEGNRAAAIGLLQNGYVL